MMVKAKGKNQTMVREINRRLVMNLLSNGSLSCTDIAVELKLSNTAVGKIVGELKDMGLVVQSESATVDVVEMGRKPIMYSLAKNKFMIGVVNLAESMVMLIDLSGEIIVSKNFEKASIFTGKMLAKLIDELHNMQNKYNFIEMVAVCVVTFGLLDTVSGEYVFANRFEDYKGINLVKMFKDEFKVTVHVINDTKLNLIAEMEEGQFIRTTNGVLLQVDIGVAAALLLNGVSFAGEKGFAGEAGLMKMSNGQTLEDSCSVPNIVKAAAASVGRELELSEVATLYASGDKQVENVVNVAAIALAEAIKNMVHLLDTQVVICGRVVVLGEKFLDVIKSQLKGSYITAKVGFSSIDFDEAARIGSIKFSMQAAFEQVATQKSNEK